MRLDGERMTADDGKAHRHADEVCYNQDEGALGAGNLIKDLTMHRFRVPPSRVPAAGDRERGAAGQHQQDALVAVAGDLRPADRRRHGRRPVIVVARLAAGPQEMSPCWRGR
jgi:hypothetical protein